MNFKKNLKNIKIENKNETVLVNLQTPFFMEK